jgi:hypothetical protein
MDIFIEGNTITNTQPFITSLGTIQNLTVNGQTTFSNFFSNQANTTPLNVNFFNLNPIHIGNQRTTFQNTGSISIGQGTNSIAIGTNAGNYNQGQNSIAIGNNASQTNQGSGSIAIGNLAGSNQGQNSIVISATGSVVTGAMNNSTYIAPVRNITQTNVIGYNTITNEVTHFTPSVSGLGSERIRIPISDNQASFNSNVTIKWTGTQTGSMTGFSNNTTTGVMTFSNAGLYFFFIKIKFNLGTNSGQKNLWFSNSVDAGTDITETNYATVTRYAQQNWTNVNQYFVFNYSVNVQSSDLPFTCAVGWNQTADSAGALTGTTSDSNDPTNIAITRIF